jgi:hypothetical protein
MSSSSAKRVNIVDRPLSKPKAEVSLSAFSFLFSELVQYSQTKSQSTSDIEKKLEDAGYGVGIRCLELFVFRDKAGKRETRVVGILGFVQQTVWKNLFGKPADSLEVLLAFLFKDNNFI